MDVTQAELEAAALNLPPEARARLAERLLASLEDDPGVGPAWLDAAARRDAEIATGRVAEVPAEEAFARARKKLR
ncbi:MAG: addiction module protein [Gemmatimonadales bacterium]